MEEPGATVEMPGSVLTSPADELFEDHDDLVWSHDRALDDKGRIVLPPTFRHCFADGGRLLPWPQKTIALWPIENFRRMDRHLRRRRRQNLGNPNARDAMLGGACPATPDSQGRIFIPEALRDYVGIERDIVVIGSGHFVKIMLPPHWQEIRDDGTVAYFDEIETGLGY